MLTFITGNHMLRTLLYVLMLMAARNVVAAQSATVAAGAQEEAKTLQRSSGVVRISVSYRGTPVKDAIDDIAKRSNTDIIFSPAKLPNATVTYQGNNLPVETVLATVLRNTGFHAERTVEGSLKIVADRPQSQSVLTGKVTDVKTGKGIIGANVSINNGSRGVSTGDEGSYRIPSMDAGNYVVSVRSVGYAKQTRAVTLGMGATVVADFRMEPSANVLDQVVVTGSVVATELKAVPNAITVVTAKEIEERGITRIDQLFRGDIPGLFAQNQGSNSLLDEVTMFSRGTTMLPTSTTSLSITNPIKTYIDGIEMADPKYLSQIDPKSIERIEILTGPQASTIYGSNAINGVMQIFTKRGATSHPQLTLNLFSGWVENNFSGARTPQHDYSMLMNGIEGRLSYNAGGSWYYIGPWTPAKQTTRISGFGGARFDMPTSVGRITTDISIQRNIKNNRVRGNALQTQTGYRETGWYVSDINTSGLGIPATHTLTGQTLGLTLGYAPTGWWSHEFVKGSDVSDTEQRYTGRGYRSVSDTTLYLAQNHADRHSLRYTTTVSLPITSSVQSTITAGADSWKNLTSSVTVQPQTLTGPLTGTTQIARQPGHNTGGFLQTQLGIMDRLFVTYGLRAEWNPGFGEDVEPSYAPRYGLAYTHDIGFVTAKLRGSYGRSTRPPLPNLKTSQAAAEYYALLGNWSFMSPYYAPYDYRMANSDLTPEHQQGGEGGLELYFGSRGSLTVTRYNQTVDGLISLVNRADSVRSLAPNPMVFGLTCAQLISFGLSEYCSSQDNDGYGYLLQSQYLNIGSIRNQGWELQGSMNLGPITTRGTYSWTKSRTIGITPKYRALFANIPQYQPGATFRFLPEHTWAIGVTYAKSASTVAFNMTGAGRTANAFDDFFHENIYNLIRLPQNRLSFGPPSNYISFNKGYALADITASHRFVPRLEGVLQIQNLTDHYVNDYYAAYAIMGRQTKIGLRVR